MISFAPSDVKLLPPNFIATPTTNAQQHWRVRLSASAWPGKIRTIRFSFDRKNVYLR
jgi:hypothetical protein